MHKGAWGPLMLLAALITQCKMSCKPLGCNIQPSVTGDLFIHK